MNDKDRTTIPRRKAILTTAGIGSALLGVPGAASAGDGSDSFDPDEHSKYILDEEYWRNEDGEVVFDHANFEQWEIVPKAKQGQSAGAQTADASATPEIYLGTHKNATRRTGPAVVNVGDAMTNGQVSTMGSDTRVTLVSGSIPDYVPGIGGTTWGINAGVTFNISALSVDISINLRVGNTQIVLWGWSLGPEGDKGTCMSVTPSQFPVEVEPCIDVTFDGDTLRFGGSVSLCAPPTDPCPGFNCQYCITGVSVSAPPIEAPW
ncbi:hypothetical protein [Halorussus aquaticus]|uniref:SipW-cognate class signal peptide n=1 Tax=Halorussus aquaticus TaxID=2953748 RepID=A0ABD5PZD5_9EURY|nr:hypothetical protein [Halorussus aquaticus]